MTCPDQMLLLLFSTVQLCPRRLTHQSVSREVSQAGRVLEAAGSSLFPAVNRTFLRTRSGIGSISASLPLG